MDTLLSKAVSSTIVDSINKNSDSIREDLLCGIKENATPEEFVSQVVYNSIRISVDMSVKTIMDILISQNLIQTVDEKQLRALLLTPLE